MGRTIRLNEEELSRMIRRCVNEALSYTQMRNVTGITDNDEWNAAADTERREALQTRVWKVINRLAGPRRDKFPMEVDFGELCSVLEKEFGFRYDRSETGNSAYVFTNGEDELWLYTTWAYRRPGKEIDVVNIDVDRAR